MLTIDMKDTVLMNLLFSESLLKLLCFHYVTLGIGPFSEDSEVLIGGFDKKENLLSSEYRIEDRSCRIVLKPSGMSRILSHQGIE